MAAERPAATCEARAEAGSPGATLEGLAGEKARMLAALDRYGGGDRSPGEPSPFASIQGHPPSVGARVGFDTVETSPGVQSSRRTTGRSRPRQVRLTDEDGSPVARPDSVCPTLRGEQATGR